MQKLIDHLNALGNGEIMPYNTHLGLCDDLEENFSYEDMLAVKSYFKDWEFFSGSIAFPVPHDKMDSTDAYFFEDDLWSNNTYGDNRRLLCNFLAEYLTENELK